MAVYEDQFSPRHDFPLVEAPTTYYVIASTPRCGSHLLGHTLFQAGVFGFPLEYFNPVNFPQWSERFGTSTFADTYAAIRARRTSPNGFFGTKLHFSHFKRLMAEHRFEDLFPEAKVIHLEREDVLAQAVSLAKARQTKSWIAAQPVQAEPAYDVAAIDGALQDIVCANASWRLALGRHGWPSMRVTYEDFVRTPDHVLSEIARFLEVDLNGPGEQAVRLPERQSDGTNREWKSYYLAEPKGGVDEVGIRRSAPPLQRGVAGRVKRAISHLLRASSTLLKQQRRGAPQATLRWLKRSPEPPR